MEDICALSGQLVYFTAMVVFMVLWYIFSRFGVMYQEQSGKPGCNLETVLFFSTVVQNSSYGNRIGWIIYF
jgi:hypothetical protein